MQQGGQGQDSEERHPSSPRGGSAGNTKSMSQFSLLGQQLTNCASQQQYHHQTLQSHQGLEGTHSNTGNMNFSLGLHSQSQMFSQGGQSQPGGAGGGGSNDGCGGFSNLHGMNSLASGGQGFAQNLTFIEQQILQGQACGSSSVPDSLFKVTQQATLGGNGGGPLAPELLLSALSTIKQKIGQLEQIVPLLNANQQLTIPLIQQKAAEAITQIAQVAVHMFQQPQQLQTNNSSIPIANASQSIQDAQRQQQQLIQIFGGAIPPTFNFFQQGQTGAGGSQAMNMPSGTNGLVVSNSFPALDGVGGGPGSGVNMGMGISASSLASQLGVGTGVQQGNQSNSGLGPINPSVDVQSYGGGQKSIDVSAATATNSSIGTTRSAATASNGKHHGGCRNTNQLGMNGVSGGSPSSTMVGGAAEVPSLMGNLRSSNLTSGGMLSSGVMGDDEDLNGGLGGLRDEDDDIDAEMARLGSYELVEMEAVEILAEHKHFCDICGKGFKRDANLRMHMRGHGDEYKTAAALARPGKGKLPESSTAERPKRFSCPFFGCKRNKRHRKFMPLKTLLCVKNHYRRSHCPKSLRCAKCKTKRFSVVADLKTHEKHCGCDKWQCSCGTTFSRKDKLLGHIALFAGHTPALPFSDAETSSGGLVEGQDTNPSAMSIPGGGSHNTSGAGVYGLSSGTGTSAVTMGLGGGDGKGMGLGLMHGMSRVGPGGVNGLSDVDGTVVGSESCPSSNVNGFPSAADNLVGGSSMLQGLFTNKFLQNNSMGNSSLDSNLQ